ncbi:unnamed protein product [Fraxinus pennsylvanica]|uniref:Plastid-targeted protein 4 n=1 Tax=Fraxinus pennsylvanica TaxID=56036 RepID=A0AAD1YSM5_9LAMI|nr:unnamed protein product [Fraxinus pennsylvanica]
MASFIVGSSLSTGFHVRSNSRVQTLSWNPISKLGFSKQKDQCCFWSKSSVECNNKNTRSIVVYASSVPGAPLPSGPPSNSIWSWILGILVSVVLPFFTHKLGQLGVLKNRIENAVEQVEQIVEVVEKVAEKVDKIADDIMDDLPEGQLKNIVNYVEDMAEKTAKSADSIGDLIDKVQEAEDQMESFVESLDDEARKSPTEAN